MAIRPPLSSGLVQCFVRTASENGFTRADILWVLRETIKECRSDSARMRPPHGLYIEILKEKTMMMVDARRTVMMACQELGIKTEGLYGKVADAGHTGSEAE